MHNETKTKDRTNCHVFFYLHFLLDGLLLAVQSDNFQSEFSHCRPGPGFFMYLALRFFFFSGLLDITIAVSAEYESYHEFVSYLINNLGTHHGIEVGLKYYEPRYDISNNV